MDTMNQSDHSPMLLTKRRLCLLAIGGGCGMFLEYAVLPTHSPIVSIALGFGLLAAAIIGHFIQSHNSKQV